MPKPTKQQQIEIRRSTYRDQMPERCCGTCRFASFGPWADTRGQCRAIRIRNNLCLKTIRHAGLCDLYEPKGE